MKDFFEQYLNNMPSSSSGTPSKTQDKSGAQASTPIPDSTDLLAKKADVLQPPAAQADNPESNLPPETDEPVSLWETKILKTVLPSKLVWAPFYRFGNQRFCARICDNDEIERDLYIQTPILDSEVVVEFIRVPTTKRMDTRLLKVEKNKILPYYGKIEADEATCLTHWNVNLLKKMHKV